MTLFQLPSVIFPENAITRAELTYQRRSTKTLSTPRRWLFRMVVSVAVAIALIGFCGLLVASITQLELAPLAQPLNPLLIIFILLTFFYHLYLMFKTMSLAAHSITREKEAQTWEMLILTGIDARQIVRGKWWAVIRQQLPRYVLLSVLRMGMIAALGVIISTAFYAFPYSYYNVQAQNAHPLTILFIGIMGFAFSAANLGLCAACGVMASAISQRSSFAIVRGFANQIAISIGLSLAGLLFINRLYDFRIINSGLGSYIAATTIPLSFIDNGIFGSTSYIGPFFTRYYEQLPPSLLKPIPFEWMVSVVISLAIYALVIRFLLWRAEKNAVRSLATSSN